MPESFDVNVQYPLKDFLVDLQEIVESLRSNVVDFPQVVDVMEDEETGEVHNLRLNTKHPIYTITTHFLDKYGWEEGSSRLARYRAVSRFLKTYESKLIENKLSERKVGGSEVNDAFLDYLLSVEIHNEDEEIPESIIEEFLNTRE